MDPLIPISRNTGISFYSYTVFKPTVLNHFASDKVRAQSLHIEEDFEKKIQLKYPYNVPYAVE